MSDDYKPVLRPGSDPVVFFKQGGAGEGGPIARGHTMAAAIAHALRDGEVVVMGANSLLPDGGRSPGATDTRPQPYDDCGSQRRRELAS